MKKLWFLFLLILTGFYACHQEKPQLPVGNEPDYEKAKILLSHHNDSAFYYFNKAAANSKDSLQIARAYNQMAAIQSDAGDHFGSQESLLTSLKFLNEREEKNRKCLASDYNELGSTSTNLKNYDAALDYFDRALQFSDNPQFQAMIRNDQANAYQKKKDYVRALQIYRASITQVTPNGIEYARILSNMARTKWLRNPGYHAAPELLQALGIRIKENDLTGQNASYVHLADYYMRTRPDSALRYAAEMYRVARRIPSADDKLDALQKLVRLSSPKDAQQYFTLYQVLNDSVQTARSAARNQFALIRYDAEKNKTENLRLQKENTDKRYQLIIRNIQLYSAGVLFLVLTSAGWFWYRKRKQQMMLEARERELRLSQKVHDGVANGLYRVMKQIENGEEIERELLLDEIEALYEQSRDIAHENPGSGQDAFKKKIDQLLAVFAPPGTKIAMAGNTAGLWEKVGATVREELILILQELMVNMRKHSGATQVALSFQQTDNRLEIRYTDNGIGFPPGVRFGNGLRNTENRINHLGGILTFDTQVENGVKISFFLPLT